MQTALTAVGPTYVFPIIKALTDTAIRLGLSRQDAQFASAQMVHGAAQLVLDTGRDPNALKLMIGTRTLKEDEAHALFSTALESAYEKISGAKKKLAAQTAPVS
jgi:pyrroline-5-carboxylate reductase